ncbi:hypothetical protein [Thalassospira indica]|uniref:Uncharacterized protein n=1 Tax=Thalassospira indica TaxID=1891279 RepID=A0ABN5NL18_9PROT|nr:hypothetical protein [Thalassospira indica]AXO16394.1 hypothetical protein DY252_20755 [Thalassospira indica]OAZ13662.1 hypothetical protein TH15_08565 [Thalassospira profundimaris]
MRAVLPYLLCLTPIAFAGIFVFDRNLPLLLVPVGYFISASGLALWLHRQSFYCRCLWGILTLLALLGAVGTSFYLLGPVLVEGLAGIAGFSGADEGLIIVAVASFFLGLWGLASIVAANIILAGRSMRAGAAAFVLCVIAAIMSAFWPLLAALLHGIAFAGLFVSSSDAFESSSQADIPSRTPRS